MTKLQKVCWVLVTCLGMAASFVTFAPTAWQDYVASWIQVVPQSKIVKAIVVIESADVRQLTKEQIVFCNSAKVREDAEKARIQFLLCDPDVKNRNGNTPDDLAPAINLAKNKGLPRLVLVDSHDGLADYVLPIDEAELRKRLGL